MCDQTAVCRCHLDLLVLMSLILSRLLVYMKVKLLLMLGCETQVGLGRLAGGDSILPYIDYNSSEYVSVFRSLPEVSSCYIILLNCAIYVFLASVGCHVLVNAFKIMFLAYSNLLLFLPRALNSSFVTPY